MRQTIESELESVARAWLKRWYWVQHTWKTMGWCLVKHQKVDILEGGGNCSGSGRGSSAESTPVALSLNSRIC